MLRISLFVCVIFSTLSVYKASKSGLVELDEHSFEKLINKFDAALVKFDVAYPYGDKHDAFLALALEAKEVDELLVADVNVKDYGEKDNEALAAKYGASKETFPVVKLFLKGKSEPVAFDGEKGFTTEELRKFVSDNTGLYLSLPGCVRQLDLLAAKFVKTATAGRDNVFKELQEACKQLPEKHTVSCEVYKIIMKKILEKGDEFIKVETERVKKLQSGKISEEKKKELGTRLNILQSFQYALTERSKGKNEL
ncbi:protein windbeutel [Pectinophora gossypiella]|uniref:protein windbeutel n=1 Tax=Pectinophora gossypiella TaxID=13191 RepID=UPI00214F4FA7|nr:protein windbeutel [Pectinophora gossypiella]